MRDPDKLFKGLNYLAESLWRIFHSYGFVTSLRTEIVLLLILQKECVKFLKLEPEAKDKSESLWRQSPTFKNRVKYKDSFKQRTTFLNLWINPPFKEELWSELQSWCSCRCAASGLESGLGFQKACFQPFCYLWGDICLLGLEKWLNPCNLFSFVLFFPALLLVPCLASMRPCKAQSDENLCTLKLSSVFVVYPYITARHAEMTVYLSRDFWEI